MYTERLRKSLSASAWLAGLTLLFLIACSNASQSNDVIENVASNDNRAVMEDQKKMSGDAIDSRLVSANTKFGFGLYREVLKKSEGKNTLVSPSSVAFALAMTFNGAEGETKEAMARALEISGLSLEEVNRAYAQLKAALENPDPKVQLQIANSLWAKKGVVFKPEFLNRNRQFYGAEVAELNFSDPNAPATINSWVSRKTNGKIDNIIGEISQDSVMFLINAIYFKGQWTTEFDKAQTKEDVFTLAAGNQKKHPMMSQSGSYDYLKGDSFQAVSLPYGDGRVSMYIFLPDKSSSLNQFHKNLTADNWEKWMSEFKKTKGDVVLPRFKLEYEIDLNEPLIALGMREAFVPGRANFSGMADASLFIQKVKHKTFAEVNEEGTEAAAATSVEITVTSVAQPRETFRMVVDRPFFCAIRDNKTGAILFLGSITDPQ